MKLILIPRSTALMSFLIPEHCDCQHCILYLCIRHTIHARKDAHHRGFFSLLSSLTPPTSKIVIDKIQHTPEKCQLKPTTTSEKKRMPPMWGAPIFAGTALSYLFTGLCYGSTAIIPSTEWLLGCFIALSRP